MVDTVKYTPETGEMRWLERPRDHFSTQSGWRKFNARFAGKPVGSLNKRKSGYGNLEFSLEMNGVRSRHNVARVAWELVNGPIPEGLFVDHMDTNPINNKLSNLRLATKRQNAQNTGKRKDNTSGFKGVQLTKQGRYRSKININGRQQYLGTFDRPEDAHSAYEVAAMKHFGDYANSAR